MGNPLVHPSSVFVIPFLAPSTSSLVSSMSQIMILFAVFACLISQADAHVDGCKCGQASTVCRKHQWMLIAMAGIFLTYIYMYGEMLFMRYCGCFVRWYVKHFGGRRASVHVGHAHGHGCGCGHAHGCDHDHSDCDHEHDCGSDCDHHHDCDECDHHHHDCCGCDCGHRHSEESENFFKSSEDKKDE